MAQTLIAFYCFNDNDATLVHDFSGNEWHSTSETGFTISTDTGALGKVGVFNGTTSQLNFGNVTDFNAVTGFTVVCKFKLDALPAGNSYIVRRNDSFSISVNNTGDFVFTVYDGAATPYALNHAAGILGGVWYTLVATWDGTTQKYYLNSSTEEYDAAAIFSPMGSPSTSLYVGSANGSDYFDGNIEMISFYSRCIETEEIDAIMECPTGVRFEAGDGKIQTGDLIYNNSGAKEICTWYEEFDEMEFSDGEQMFFADSEVIIFKN